MHPSASSARRAFAALAFSSGLVALAHGCGTDAVGVDACRRIETARCEQAPACTGDEDTFAIRTEEQVRNCITLYNDACLHGMENTEDGEPDEGDVDRCVEAIKATANCKRNGIGTIAECAEAGYVGPDSTETPCRVLHSVENLGACRFIKAKEEDGDTTSATTTTGGTGGAGGA